MRRLALLGATACGKTSVSLPLAESLNAEIISVDSRQIYRGMEIGSAAPTPEERARIPHHMVGVVEPSEVMSAGEFGRRSQDAEQRIRARGKEPLFVGGAGLYLRAALGGLDAELPSDPDLREALRARVYHEGVEALHAELAEADAETAGTVGVRDAQRITRALEIIQLTGRKPSELRTRGRSAERGASIVVLDRERDELETRIRERVTAMVQAGLEEEVRGLLERGLGPETPAMKSVGYAETIRYLDGDLDRQAWIEEIVVNTRRFAKRQRTWFRGIEGAVWVPVTSEEAVGEIAQRLLGEFTRVK